MADKSKLDKIAAGRKKLKQFQNRNQPKDEVKSLTTSPPPPQLSSSDGIIEESVGNIQSPTPILEITTQTLQPKPPSPPPPSAPTPPLLQSAQEIGMSEQTFIANQWDAQHKLIQDLPLFNTTNPNVDSFKIQDNNRSTNSIMNFFQNTNQSQNQESADFFKSTPQEQILQLPTPQQQQPPQPLPEKIISSENLAFEAHQQQQHYHPYATNNGTIDDLSVEKQRNQELSVQLLNQNSQIVQLSNEIQQLKHAEQNKILMEIGLLQDQLQNHVQTIGVLVGEKAELSAGLNKFQGLANQKCAEVEELQGRLNASRHRVQLLEKDLNSAKTSHHQFDTNQQRLCEELEMAQEQCTGLQKTADDLKEQVEELKQKLLIKNKEITQLDMELSNVKQELSLNQLKIEQFSSGDSIQMDGTIELLTRQKHSLEHQVQELQTNIQQIAGDRDQASQQYQGYVEQLNGEMTSLAKQLQDYVVDNERLVKREAGLVKHVGDLEKQIQQQMAKQKSFSNNSTTHHANDADKIEKESLTIKLEQLEVLKEQSEQQLQLKIQELTVLQLELHESKQLIQDLQLKLEQQQNDHPDPTNLLASIESEKVTASRAVAQNQNLKQQLEEMQKAFVQISNDKLELTEKLQSEQHFGRENKIKAGTLDAEINSVKQILRYKDEEMIRLSHENQELNKQILDLSKGLDSFRGKKLEKNKNDRIKATSDNEESNDTESLLKNVNSDDSIGQDKIDHYHHHHHHHHDHDHESDHNHDHHKDHDDHNHDHDHDHDHGHSHNCSSGKHNDDPKQSEEMLSETRSVASTVTIANEEAMEKLQQRFTRTMKDIADLTEEKNRLEHLVMQLQGETETIGEYIALYQNQRRLLRQREMEKDVQVQQIIRDREEMKNKLQQLNKLVEQLLLQKGDDATTTTPISSNKIQNSNIIEANISNTGTIDDTHQLNGNDIIEFSSILNDNIDKKISSKNVSPPTNPNAKNSVDTASKILNLLSEIQDKNQKQTTTFVESSLSAPPSFDCHNCAYCYGKLETV